MPLSREDFYAAIVSHERPSSRPRWFLSAIACLAALNHPEEVASLYTLLLKTYLPEDEQMSQTRSIRETLTTLTGIIGAARIGNALRLLSEVTPDELRDGKCYRKDEDHEAAVARGKDFIRSIYGEESERARLSQKASPDYDFIMKDLFYAHIFSFPQILSVFETGQTIVSALLASNCPTQAAGHMLGMLRNGASREEVVYIREISLKIISYWGVKPFGSAPDVPVLEQNMLKK